MRRVQLGLLFCGAILFVLLVRRTGFTEIIEQVAQTGWMFGWVLAADLLLEGLHTLGWRRCFLPTERKVPYFDLFLCRKAGVAVNLLTPTATLGGEAVKAMLVRGWVSFREGIASVVVDKLTFSVGQAVFLAIGLGPLLSLVLTRPEERVGAVVVMTLWLGGLTAFWFFQRNGIFGRGMKAFSGFFADRAGSTLSDRVKALDKRIVAFLRERPGDLAVSILFHAAAQSMRVLQFWFTLHAFGMEPGLVECFAMATGFVFIEATLFIVPGKLGVFEGGTLIVFTMLGYDASTGLAVAFVLRISELTALLPGLFAFARYGFRPGQMNLMSDSV